MKELSKSESILNEYVMNTSELTSSREHVYTQQSINNNLSLRLQSNSSTIKMTPFNKYSMNNHYNNKLINAIECNEINKIKDYLKKDSSNLNILNEKGISPLHIAVINGNLEIIKLLIKYGANPNIISKNKNQTPLHFAYIFKSLFFNQIINLLLKYNANPNIEDIYKKRPCEYLSKYKESNEVENTLSKENDDDIEINNNTNISSYKNNINRINNKDTYNENKNNNTYTISDSEVTISQSYSKRNNSGYYNIEELINCKQQNGKYKKTKIKIIGKNTKHYKKFFNFGRESNSVLNINNNYFLSKDNDINDSVEINFKDDIIYNNIYDNNCNTEDYYNKSKNNSSKNKKIFLNNSYRDLRTTKKSVPKSFSLGYKAFKLENKKFNREININGQYYFSNEFFNNYYNNKSHIKSTTKNKSSKIPKNNETRQNSGLVSSMPSTHNQTSNKEKSFQKNINNVTEFIYPDDNSTYNDSENTQILKKWLTSIELPFYYDNFINNNVYDIKLLLNEIKIKSGKINYEYLENLLKIHKSGHIYRILCKLEMDAGFVENKICNFLVDINGNTIENNSKKNKNISTYLQSKECYDKCYNCGDNKKPLIEKKDLKTFLRKYNLLHLYDNFYHNGFNLINYVILQMYTKYSINDDIVQKSLHIYKKKDRYLVLDALFNEVKEINIFFSTNIHNYCLFPKYENNDWSSSWNDESINTDNESSNGCIII